MMIPFTKMQGAGNDFVVLDETQISYGLTPQQYRFLADRHFGVGADQILSVRPASVPGVDFDYVIHNADGGEVEHCGNGARCFVRYVQEKGLTDKSSIAVKTQNRVLTLTSLADGRVTVDMGVPQFDWARIPYTPDTPDGERRWDGVVSMGNPHAVCRVDGLKNGLNTADMAQFVSDQGRKVQANAAFPQGVNVGFMHVLDRSNIELRVYERGAGETLACGTGACAAVVVGIQNAWLNPTVNVRMLGGDLSVSWNAAVPGASVMLTGPATTVYHGTIAL